MSFDFKAFWGFLAALGPAGMFVVTAADTAFLPTAQAVDLLVLTQAAANPGAAWLLGVCAVAGSTFGAMTLYWIARGGGGWALRRSVSEERLERIRGEIRRYDAAALILPTALPLPFAPMKIFIVAAGALGVSSVRTAAAIVFARTLRYGGLILLGIYYGQQAWAVVRDNAVWAALACVVVFVWWLVVQSSSLSRARKQAVDGPAQRRWRP